MCLGAQFVTLALAVVYMGLQVGEQFLDHFLPSEFVVLCGV
jgi:hypothetical protein